MPADLERSATTLRNSFSDTERQILLDRQLIGNLCETFDCGELTEKQASQLLSRHFEELDRITTKNERFESRLISWLSLAFAAIGLLISWLAYNQSKQADRRSVRNEVEIEHLKKGSEQSTVEPVSPAQAKPPKSRPRSSAKAKTGEIV